MKNGKYVKQTKAVYINAHLVQKSKMCLQFISKIMKILFREKNKFFDLEKVKDFELV